MDGDEGTQKAGFRGCRQWCVAHPRVKVLPAGERRRGTCPLLVGVRDEKRLRRARKPLA